MSSLLLKTWLGKIETVISLLFQVIIELSYSSIVVFKFVTTDPSTRETFANNPSPEVLVLSKFKVSFTLNDTPAPTILNPVIEPEDTDSTLIFWSTISLVSIKKSLSAFTSATLYGKVFLTKLELLKLKDWSTSIKLSLIILDL